MIDTFTRMNVSVFMRDKKLDTVIHYVMKNWVSVGYSRPGKIWTDVGGKFENETVRQLGEALGTKAETGEEYAAWMNGLNEQNHSIIDRCFMKIMKEDPKLDRTIALAWAVIAKNSFAMYGDSSFQLIFGKNPKLQNIMTDKFPALNGVPTRKSVAGHINALHVGRKAFNEAICDEKVRKALRQRVRAVEWSYNAGEKVYYKGQ